MPISWFCPNTAAVTILATEDRPGGLGFGARLNAMHKIVRRASSRQTWLALDPLPSGEFTLL